MGRSTRPGMALATNPRIVFNVYKRKDQKCVFENWFLCGKVKNVDVPWVEIMQNQCERDELGEGHTGIPLIAPDRHDIKNLHFEKLLSPHSHVSGFSKILPPILQIEVNTLRARDINVGISRNPRKTVVGLSARALVKHHLCVCVRLIKNTRQWYRSGRLVDRIGIVVSKITPIAPCNRANSHAGHDRT